MGSEQRRFDRVSGAFFDAQCRRYGALAEPWRPVKMSDISAGGMSFESDEMYEVSDTLEIQLRIPSLQEPLILRGRFVRGKPLPAGGMWVAIEFADVTPDQQAELDEIIQFLKRPPSTS